MLNRLGGQPESYDKKSKYRFGRTLGAGTYGVVREAEGPTGRVAIKIILKKNVKGNEGMVYDELNMLQRLKHPHIVRFVDWFESREALNHIWLSGKNATDHDLLPEIRTAREARARLKHAILAISLKKRLAALKADDDSD
ncbi:hypothetical protein GMORB2_6214, partial [Geosmithia morbida]